LNKGAALKALEKLTGAIASYDKSIAIFKDLIETQERADLAGQLAMVYMNKGSALEAQNDLTEAVKMFGSAIEIWEKDFKDGYSNVVTDLIKALRIRTLISVKLEDWQQTAMDVVFAMLLFENYLKKQNYSEHYKKNISSEFYVILFQLKQLAEEDREQVFALTDKIGREAYDPPVEFGSVLRQRIELI
jgi:tetratricopeptide (TPR) repeat protein